MLKHLLLFLTCAALLVGTRADASGDMYIVAHQDDDLLFANPDISNAIARGRNVTTVYITAGDVENPAYIANSWMGREKGILNAYAQMAKASCRAPGATTVTTNGAVSCNTGAQGNWTLVSDSDIIAQSNTHFNYAHFQFTLSSTQAIHLVFLRLTDIAVLSNEEPAQARGVATLQYLWNHDTATYPVALSSNDCIKTCTWTCNYNNNTCTGQQSCALNSQFSQRYQYKRQDLIDVLTALMYRFTPQRVGALDSTHLYAREEAGAGGATAETFCPENRVGGDELPSSGFQRDNCSHVYAGHFALAAYQRYVNPDLDTRQFFVYRGYDIDAEAQNLSPEEIQAKQSTYQHYEISDLYNRQAINGQDTVGPFGDWIKRRYAIVEVGGMKKLTGPLARDAVPSDSGVKCLHAAADGSVTAEPCESSNGTVPSERIWTLEKSGVIKNGSRCLQIQSGGTAVAAVTPCPSLNSNLRWSLFSNGQLRGGEAGKCLTQTSTGVELQSCHFGDDVTQRWTLQFGTVAQWSSGTEFSDTVLPFYTGDSDSKFRTFGLIDVNNDGLADACIRRVNGIWCANNNGSGGFSSWGTVGTSQTAWNDTAGWNASKYGSTLMYGHTSPAQTSNFVCGRGSDGIYCGSFADSSHALYSTAFSDFNNDGVSTDPTKYGSIRMVDVNHDGLLDICGRKANGVYCTLGYSTSTGDGFQDHNASFQYTSEFSDASGWNQASYGTTLQYGDVDGDGYADFCGRGADGLRCVVQKPDSSTPSTNNHVWSYQTRTSTNCVPLQACNLRQYSGDLSDNLGWGSASHYYRSLRLVDINGDGMADACGRGYYGIVCAYSTGTAFSPLRPVMNRNFTYAKGWNAEQYGASLSFGRLSSGGDISVCARGDAVYCTSIGMQ